MGDDRNHRFSEIWRRNGRFAPDFRSACMDTPQKLLLSSPPLRLLEAFVFFGKDSMAYKFKPNKSVVKRFRVTKTGKLKRSHSFTSHLMSSRPAYKLAAAPPPRDPLREPRPQPAKADGQTWNPSQQNPPRTRPSPPRPRKKPPPALRIDFKTRTFVVRATNCIGVLPMQPCPRIFPVSAPGFTY